jgi:hypothetical protein
MAKVSDDGSLSGRLGDLVYYKRNGKSYVRKFTQPKDPKLPAQKMQRAKLRTTIHCLKYFKDVLRIGFQNSAKTISPFFEAVKYHMQTEFKDITPPDQANEKLPVLMIKIENIKLARGHLSSPEILTCNRMGNVVSLTWNTNLGDPPNRHTDMLAMIAGMSGKKATTQFNTGARSIGFGEMKLPAGFNEVVHLWVFFWNGEKGSKPGEENVSDSVYLGVF